MNRFRRSTSLSTVFLLTTLWVVTILVVISPVHGATITVDTAIDLDLLDGLCSLREAITAANDDIAYGDCVSGDGPDRIDFDLTLPAIILLTDHLPAIAAPLAVHGPGALDLAIDGDTLYRPLEIDSPGDDGWVLIEDLSLTNGLSPETSFPENSYRGGGARVAPGDEAIFRRVRFIGNRAINGAGGLYVSSATSALARVTVRDCLFAENVSEGPSGGGGLFVHDRGSVLRVFGSTFVGNRAEHENGTGAGLRAVSADLWVEGSTLSGNISNGSAGGISVSSGTLVPTIVTLRDTTITGNVATDPSGIQGGGGVRLSRKPTQPLYVTIESTVVAGNLDFGVSGHPEIACLEEPPDLLAINSTFLASNEGCSSLIPAGTPNSDGNFVGTSAAPLEAWLGPLGDHGGPTLTHAPLLTPLSPLIDQGHCPDAASDQRGNGNATTGRRPVNLPDVPDPVGGDGCDIGSVEVRSSAAVDPSIFADGFEAGHGLLWAGEEP
ncbi:MAG: hypothetical protein MPN21_20310 [Thermoanaerobaculia bacterium]|nr:hypothetical protein [Thermoanaerobaculia bacterium]